MENVQENESSVATKVCTYCGEEVLATAKKCKHCGKWLEKQCPQCSEWVNAEAKKCRFCGYWFDAWQRRLQEKAEEEKNKPNTSLEEIQAAKEEKKEDEKAGCLMWIESVFIIGICSYIYDWTWWNDLIAGVIILILLNITVLRILYCIAVSLVWGIIAVCFSPWLFNESEWEMTRRVLTDDYTDYWWMGLIAAILSLAFHEPAMKSRFNF